MPVKAVLDTNIRISYFINARANYLIKWIIRNPVTIFTSQELIDEIEEVLTRPKFKKQFPYPVSDFLSLHLQVCEFVRIIKEFHFAPDADDNFLFDLCKKVNVEYLITSDKKILAYKPPFNLDIVTFQEFRSKF